MIDSSNSKRQIRFINSSSKNKNPNEKPCLSIRKINFYSLSRLQDYITVINLSSFRRNFDFQQVLNSTTNDCLLIDNDINHIHDTFYKTSIGEGTEINKNESQTWFQITYMSLLETKNEELEGKEKWKHISLQAFINYKHMMKSNSNPSLHQLDLLTKVQSKLIQNKIIFNFTSIKTIKEVLVDFYFFSSKLINNLHLVLLLKVICLLDEYINWKFFIVYGKSDYTDFHSSDILSRMSYEYMEYIYLVYSSKTLDFDYLVNLFVYSKKEIQKNEKNEKNENKQKTKNKKDLKNQDDCNKDKENQSHLRRKQHLLIRSKTKLMKILSTNLRKGRTTNGLYDYLSNNKTKEIDLTNKRHILIKKVVDLDKKSLLEILFLVELLISWLYKNKYCVKEERLNE